VYIKKVYTPPLKTRKGKNFIARWGLKFLKCKMLKWAFISGLEECVFFVWRDLPTKCYLALCIIFVASSEMEKWWTHGGMKYVWIYISHIVIFSG